MKQRAGNHKTIFSICSVIVLICGCFLLLACSCLVHAESESIGVYFAQEADEMDIIIPDPPDNPDKPDVPDKPNPETPENTPVVIEPENHQTIDHSPVIRQTASPKTGDVQPTYFIWIAGGALLTVAVILVIYLIWKKRERKKE